MDARLVELARGANLWILDAHYDSEERQCYKGWGHSSHLEFVKLALAAGVETAVLFHHHPDRDDSTLDRMALKAVELAADSRTKVLMARDGMVVDVGRTPDHLVP